MGPRALEALKKASIIYCEDTRRTRILTSYFGISAPLKRYDEHNPKVIRQMLDELKGGKNIALVSDGGLPGISDPGHKIVALARKENIEALAIPGPSAVVAALAGSGLPADSFIFLGFLPRAPGKRRRILETFSTLQRTIVLYESPFRVKNLMQELFEVFSSKAQCAVAREISKIHEEWFCGNLEEVKNKIDAKEPILGEFVVMIHPKGDLFNEPES